MAKKIGSLIVAFMLVVTLFSACGGPNQNHAAPSGSAPAQSDGVSAPAADVEGGGELSGTITVSTLAGDPFQSSWRAMFDVFEEQTGVTVILDAIPWENLREKQALELASDSGSYDVVYVHPFWFEELASNGYLVPLEEFCDAADLDKFIPSLLELYHYNGTAYGLPDWIATQVFAYRKDLFEEAGLPEPRSWSDMINAAQTLADGDSMYGVTFPGRTGGALAGLFNSILLSNGSWILDANGNPNINSEAAVETAEFLEAMSRFAPPGYQNFHWEESSTVAGVGRAAMAMLMTTNVRWLEDPERSETVGLWGYVPFNNKTSGGMVDSYCWAVTRVSRNQDAAAALAKFMADTQVQIYLTEHMGTSGATKAYYENEELQRSNPILAAMSEAFAHSAPNPAWATWNAEQEVLELGLQDLFNGRTSAREVVDAAQAKMLEGR